MAKFHFRCLAMQDTCLRDLVGTPAEGMDGFSVMLILEGERTHICSLTPNSKAVFLECDYLDHATCQSPGLDDEETQTLYDMDTGERPGDVSYIGFVDMERADRRFLSRRLTVSVDVRKHKTPTRTWGDAYRAASDAAWEEAEEYFQGNGRMLIPVLDEPNVWRDYQREQAPREIARTPLFSHAAQQGVA